MADAEALFSQAFFDYADDQAVDEDAARAVDRLALSVLGHATGDAAQESGE